MSLLNPDLSNLEIKLDNVIVCERKQTLKYEGETNPITDDLVILASFKANRNDIIFEGYMDNPLHTEYGLYIMSGAIGQSSPFVGRFKCTTNGKGGQFSLDNLLVSAGTETTITLDENSGGEGGGT